MNIQHCVLCLDKTDLLACEHMWEVFTWVASKIFGNVFFFFPSKFPLPASFCCLWAAQTQKLIQRHESERSFQDFLAKNQQWRKSFAWVSSPWNIILFLWILKHKGRILIHLQGAVLWVFLDKLTLCNEIFIASGNKQNNIFLKALPTSELLHF